ncbi:PRC-barrel domain-containing protein [Deinococcus sp. Marseille-Q6407]|uniref:PRC-barrel domain-containing protein n=1 Tax=Deinococcus sp. Marseille-Q6407 TaxID=2969223 RepID=UPI0021BE5427|nr:PRC-barrel domain-containing protein [Deinococcus sp. Marseille-Q6407]
MIKGKELLGRHVVDLSTGERVDSVRDIVFDHGANLVLGLVVDGGGTWLRRHDRLIPFSAVYSVGEDAVMITSAQDTASEEEQARMKELMASDVNLVGMSLLTSHGEDLGKISDVIFDEYSGRVTGYEVSGGLFGGAAGGGSSYVPAPESVQIGKDVAIVPASVAEELRRTGGQWPSEAPQEAHPYGSDHNTEELAEEAALRQREYAVGRIAGTSIVLPDGTVVAEKGEPITEEQAIRAERSGRLMVLVSTSLSPEEAEAAALPEQTVQEGEAPQNLEPLQDMPLQVETAATEAVFAAAPAAEASDAAASDGLAPQSLAPQFLAPSDLVGRRVREDVLDGGGNLIAAQGQIITPAVLTRAEEQGALEQLQRHLRGTESAAEPVDLGEYERRSAEPARPQPHAAPTEAHEPAETMQLEATPVEPVVVESAPLDTALVDTAPAHPEPLLIPDQEGRLSPLGSNSVESTENPRPMRAREEQVAHLSEPLPGQEPGLLEKAGRWLSDRREELLHGPEERELVQVHEQWGAPLETAEPPVPEHSADTVTAPNIAVTPAQADDALIFSGPAPEVQEQPDLSSAPAAPAAMSLSAGGPAGTPAPARPAADPLQPAGAMPELTESPAELQAELAHPAPALQHTPQPPLDPARLAADPLQPRGAEPGPGIATDSAAAAQPEDHQPTELLPLNSPSSESFDQAIEHIISEAYGWPVSRAIRAESGEEVLPEGGRVTPAVVAEARRLGVLRELLSAVERGQ